MKKVVTFGEIMGRLSPPGYGRIIQAQSLNITYGGGEANVAGVGIGLGMLALALEHADLLGQAVALALQLFGAGLQGFAFVLQCLETINI